LINLLENATKFTFSEGEITVGAATEAEWVRFWVKDTGTGIPAEALDQIFNKFTRLPSDPFQPGSKVPKGLGLGLAFCKLAVQALGGKIGVESEMGAGSCFFFTVPIAKEP
ncbi:MAG TPA: ATP-binding protein, partial [Anaerolineaceae bacterium]